MTEHRSDILHKTSEATLDAWNLIVPKKAPNAAITTHAVFDGIFLTFTAFDLAQGDLLGMGINMGVAGYLHYVTRKKSGSWK